MSPAEYGRHLARQAPPLTPYQVRRAAQIFVSIERDKAKKPTAKK